MPSWPFLFRMEFFFSNRLLEAYGLLGYTGGGDMNNSLIAFTIVLLLLFVGNVWAGEVDTQHEIDQLNHRVEELENNAVKNGKNADKTLQSVLSGLEITGGISAGIFYTSNPGEDASDNEFLLSNLLVEISQKDKSSPVGFMAAIGQTSTPSILGSPENTNSLDIEYASLTLTPVTGLTAEVGLLQPNAGYENSYTFNNVNTFLGALASQQPYNAYGGRLGYDIGGFHLCAGYYKNRLDDEEYETNGSTANESWELGASGKVLDSDVSLYHYHLESLRSLTGGVIQHSIGNVDLAFDLDYWRWEGDMRSAHGDDDSIGGAFYIVPRFGKFSVPLRLEYIDQGKSGIYLDSEDAKQIYAATLSPTYHLLDNAYVRADLGYVKADDGFIDKDGKVKSDRVCLAAEIGYTF
jgi:hypothetical protein